MNLTDEMVQAAIKKAIEAGLLPRHPSQTDLENYKELMQLVVRAALSESHWRRVSGNPEPGDDVFSPNVLPASTEPPSSCVKCWLKGYVQRKSPHP